MSYMSYFSLLLWYQGNVYDNKRTFCPPFVNIGYNGQQNPVAERRGFVVEGKKPEITLQPLHNTEQ